MPYAESFLSRDQSLFAISDSDIPRAYTEITTAMSGWTASNASTFAISLENREYQLFYTFELQADNDGAITLSIDNISVPGVIATNFNSYKLIGHALFKSSSAINVNSTLTARSTLDTSRSTSRSAQTTLTPLVQAPVKTGEISVLKRKTALISEIFGNGTFIKYIGDNLFKRGEAVNIYGTTSPLPDFSTNTATVQYACNNFFTVADTTKDHIFPTAAYANKLEPAALEQSFPFPQYSGEDLVCGMSFSITGHGRNKVYITIPKIVDMNRIFASYSTNFGLSQFPQVYIDIDEESNPQNPVAKLVHTLTSGVEQVVDRYVSISRYDPNLQSGFVAIDDNINQSSLVNPDSASPDYYNWLSQIVGQTKCYSSIYSDESADYGSTIKVRCATTANITISTALNAGDSIDGVVLADEDRVLVKNQSTASQNGIYIVGTTPARWTGMAASSTNITAVAPTTPSSGYVTYTASSHGLTAGQPVVIADLAPSGYNGQFIIDSVTTNTFTVASTAVATVTDSAGTVKKAVNTTSPDLIFIREGTVNKMTMWSPSDATWPVIGTDTITLAVKQVSAKVATTDNIAIATALNNADIIDGVTLATNDYVLVKNQTTASENGLYKVGVTPARAENMAASLVLAEGFRAYVWGAGTTSSKTMFTLDGAVTINSGSPTFTATTKPFAWDDEDEFKLWQIKNKYYGYKAGSLESLAETIKRYLIGDKEVRITYSHPFGIIISTLKDETLGIYNGNTSSEVILTAATPTMPMGFIMTHIVVDNFGVFTIGSSIIGTGELG